MQPQTVFSMLRVDTELLCSTGWLASRKRWGAQQPATLDLCAGHLVVMQQSTQTTALCDHSAPHCAGV